MAVFAAACGSSPNGTNADSTSLADETGESFTSCVAATATDWVASSGALTIDATANTTGTIIVTPGNSVVKINGRTCKTESGTTIPLTSVKTLSVRGKSGQSDTFLLDFSAGLPKAKIVIDGGEAATAVTGGGLTTPASKTPDTVVIKGSTGADAITVGLDSAAAADQGQIDISLTATNKVNDVVLRKVGQRVRGPFQPFLIFNLGAGNDIFSGLGFGSGATSVTFGMSIYGGEGDDTITGGTGGDKIVGGGQPLDTLDYSARTTPVYADMDSAKPTAYGADLRNVKLADGDAIKIDVGEGPKTVVFAATDVTPALVAAKINSVSGLAGVASTIGNRLRLMSKGSVLLIDGKGSEAITKLGLAAGYYDSVANDGAAGVAAAAPWAAPSAWNAATAYSVGDVVLGTPGYWFLATVGGTSGSSGPGWDPTLGNTTTDNEVTWLCAGRVKADSANYAPGEVVYDVATGAVYKVSVGSGATLPVFNTTVGNSMSDASAYAGIGWVTSGKAWASGKAYLTGDYVVKPSGAYYKCATGGTAGTTIPKFPSVVGGSVQDGSVVWTYMGKAQTVAARHVYADGEFAVDGAGTLAIAANTSAYTTASAASFPSTLASPPVNVPDSNILWAYVGSLAEHDDVQGISVLSGGSGADILVGNSLSNTLNGNDGNDVLSGGPAAVLGTTCTTDKLNGGNNDDWFDMGFDDNSPVLLGSDSPVSALTKHDCNQTIAGGAGTDVVDYSQRTANGHLTIKLDGVTACGEQSTVLKEADKLGTDVEIVLSGAGNDTISGGDNVDFLFGGAGKDTLNAGKGDDHLYGGPGDDVLNGDAGHDTFYELTAYPGATAWNEPLGRVAPGTWAGLGLAIYGDTAEPGAGDDVIFGGADLTETNTVDYTDSAAPIRAEICSDAAATTANLGHCAPTKSDYIGHTVDGTGSTANTLVNIEHLAGSLTQDNTFIGSANAEIFEGGAGKDVFAGQGGQDMLFGSPDPDTGQPIDNTSADLLCGGDDDDIIEAGLAATAEGEGQLDALHGSSTQVALSATSATPKAVDYCGHWANARSPFMSVPGVNLCFVGSATRSNCAN